MDVEVVENEGARIVRIAGDIRTDDARELAAMFDKLLEEGDLDMVLDLEKVGYVTSAGLGHIVSIAAVLRRRGGNLAVCNLSADVRKAFQVTRIDKVVEVQNSLEAALETLRQLAARAT